MMTALEEKLSRHHAFWQRDAVDRPLVGFRIGDYLFANKYQAARGLLQEGKKITPDMLLVDDFLADYERMYRESLEIRQDAFWTASPFTAIPWMEAMLGCDVRAAEASMTSEPWLTDWNQLGQVTLDADHNPWLAKYLEFVQTLTETGQGRYPVGQPIMRGTSDMMGALRGQTNFVFDLIDHPAQIHQLGQSVTDIFRCVIQKHREATTSFHGGYAMGFYHLWCPGPCIWFQEDLSTLISPALYRKYIFELNTAICRGYDYTLCHLHPASFFLIDDLLKIDGLRAIQVNKDLGGPSIQEMLEVFQKVLRKKCLVVWGDLDYADLDLILDTLPYEGLYLHLVAPTVDEAKQLMQYIVTRRRQS